MIIEKMKSLILKIKYKKMIKTLKNQKKKTKKQFYEKNKQFNYLKLFFINIVIYF